MKMILPLLLAIAGTGGGVAAGLALRPAMDPADHGAAEPAPDAHGAPDDGHAAPPPAAAQGTADSHGGGDHGEADGLPDFVRLSNQFVVPVVEKGRVAAMVILSLSLEVTTGSGEAVYDREPKLRDAFLQVLFDHANAGGFAGTFTDGANLVFLRRALRESAVRVLGPIVSDVLIIDIVRQDN